MWTAPLTRSFAMASRRALLAAALVACPATALAKADPAPPPAAPAAPVSTTAAVAALASGDMRAFYAHAERPLWITPANTLRPAADDLLRLISTAEYDGLDPEQLRAAELTAAIARARETPTPEALAGAELALSRALTGYVGALLGGPAGSDMLYEHDLLRPIQPTAATVLRTAAEADSLEDYVGQMRWMHPMYAQIRRDLATSPLSASLQLAAESSLSRLRSLPATPWSRHVVIDIPSARLWMYEGDRPVDSMKIVVGKADTQTPQMAGYIRYAVLNPYWYVPAHLVRKTIAPNVLNQGLRYLRTRGYEVLSDWTDEAEVIDPATIDWRAAQRGDIEVVVRQKPSATNAMGSVKYEFPNPQGIYLHDTPDKQLMLEDARQFSNGCVRLEDAARFGRWLLGGVMPAPSGSPEERVDLPEPVPIYITYMTVRDNGAQLALGSDPYGLDGVGGTALVSAH